MNCPYYYEEREWCSRLDARCHREVSTCPWVSEMADVIEETVLKHSCLISENPDADRRVLPRYLHQTVESMANIMAVQKRSVEEADRHRATIAEIDDALRWGSDEGLWPPGKTRGEAIASLVDTHRRVLAYASERTRAMGVLCEALGIEFTEELTLLGLAERVRNHERFLRERVVRLLPILETARALARELEKSGSPDQGDRTRDLYHAVRKFEEWDSSQPS